MYKIIYMKADYEPWWQFDGWEEKIISTYEYMSKETFEVAFNGILQKFRKQYDNEVSKDNRYYAFWSEDEREFCEACDDDIQIYHGIIIEPLK